MENISKKVVCLEDKKVFGYILDAMFDDSELVLKGYYVVDEQSESVFLVSLENILCFGECVVVSSSSVFQFVGEKPSSLIGKIILDADGTNYGNVEKIVVEKKKVCKLVTDKCEILRKNIKSHDKDFVLVSFASKRAKAKKKVISNIDFEKKNVKYEDYITPEKVNLSANFYLGKVPKYDILGYNNERVVTKGVKITKPIFENVKKHNKLNELFFCIN